MNSANIPFKSESTNVWHLIWDYARQAPPSDREMVAIQIVEARQR